MMTFRNIGAALAGVTAVGLSACGGGSGGTRVASTPTPPPSPPPPYPPAGPPPVKIFANPTPVEYASVGASVSGPGGNLDTYSSASATLGPVSASDADQPHIRFSAGGYYEIEMPGSPAALGGPRGPDRLTGARTLARDNPAAVANIVRGWVSKESA